MICRLKFRGKSESNSKDKNLSVIWEYMSLINDNLFISRILVLEISLTNIEQQPVPLEEYWISFSQETPHSQEVRTSDILHNI